MDKFFNKAVTTKTCMALVFTGFTVIYMFLELVFDLPEINSLLLWQFLLASVIVGAMYFIFFDDFVFKHIRESTRYIGFTVTIFMSTAFIAYKFSWFDYKSILSWIIFMAIFVIFEIAWIIGYKLYFKYMKMDFQKSLEEYKSINKF